jgi:hypothetical protein
LGVELSPHAALEILGGVILTYRVGTQVKQAAGWGAIALCSKRHYGPDIKKCGGIIDNVLFPEINALGAPHSR